MKNLIILTLLLFSVLTINAQAFYLDNKSDVMANEHSNAKFRQHILDNHIITIKYYTYKNGDTVGYLSGLAKYDAKGNVTETEGFKKNGKIVIHQLFKYDDNNRNIEYTGLKSNDKFFYKNTNVYDINGNVIDYRYYYKRPDNMIYHMVYRYDDKKNMIENEGYDKKNRLYERTTYSYYDDGSKKQTILYDDKGKVDRIWNFDCNPVGTAEHDKLKDTTKVCIKYETDKNGNKIKIKEENNVREENNIRGSLFQRYVRNISKFDVNDNLIDFTSYKKNGKVIKHWSRDYDSKGNAKDYVIYKRNSNEIKVRYVYTYDNSGNMVETVSYKNSDKPDKIWKCIYEQN